MAKTTPSPIWSYADVIAERQAERERSAAEESQRLTLEQKRAQFEAEKQKQATIAQVLESLRPGWVGPGGGRMDVGGFSTAGAPMQPTTIGPSTVRPFQTSGAQFAQPAAEQQGMAQQLQRVTVGLPATDPYQLEGVRIEKQKEHDKWLLEKQKEFEKWKTGESETSQIEREKREAKAQEKKFALETQKERAAGQKKLVELRAQAFRETERYFNQERAKLRQSIVEGRALPSVASEVTRMIEESYRETIRSINEDYRRNAISAGFPELLEREPEEKPKSKEEELKERLAKLTPAQKKSFEAAMGGQK